MALCGKKTRRTKKSHFYVVFWAGRWVDSPGPKAPETNQKLIIQ